MRTPHELYYNTKKKKEAHQHSAEGSAETKWTLPGQNKTADTKRALLAPKKSPTKELKEGYVDTEWTLSGHGKNADIIRGL